MSKAGLRVRPVAEEDRQLVAGLLAREWGSTQIVSRGRPHDALRCPALACFAEDRMVGLVTYRINSGECEVLTLNAFETGRGIGSRLLEAVIEQAWAARCRRLWLTTSNDNLDAIRFYQRRGLSWVAVYPGAIDEERRRFKSEIPLIGHYGIPVRDELEFEVRLAGADAARDRAIGGVEEAARG